MSLIERRMFVNVATVGLFFLFIYYFVLSFILNDVRLSDGGLSGDEMRWWEYLIMCCGVLPVFPMWFSAIFHAFSNNRKKWGGFTLFCWPLAYVYAFKYGRKV